MNPKHHLLYFILPLFFLHSCEDKLKNFEAPEAKQWIQTHWKQPLAAQGNKPKEEGYSYIDLTPENCATCHDTQYQGWAKSLHSKAMSPGLVGQFLDNNKHSGIKDCMDCHAPLAEQKELITQGLLKKGLHQRGIVCAACHIRDWKVKGPPATGKTAKIKPQPHGGFEVVKEYQNPLFCAPCHQFPEEGYRLEGKLLVDTYNEWRVSKYAKEGITCQTCHMPDRKHLWRGIHDPEMTKKSLGIVDLKAKLKKRMVTAEITLKNQGAGHALPTYVTPSIQIDFVQLDFKGNELPQSKESAYLGRMITLNLDRELYDTRLLPEESRRFVYEVAKANKAVAIKISITVKPDEFYVRFYQELLKDPNLKEGREAIQQALEEGINNEFSLLEQVILLKKP